MNKDEVKEIQESIDIKLTETIARSVVQEMSKQEVNKSNTKIFKIICVVFSITMLICVFFTSYVGIKLLNFINNI